MRNYKSTNNLHFSENEQFVKHLELESYSKMVTISLRNFLISVKGSKLDLLVCIAEYCNFKSKRLFCVEIHQLSKMKNEYHRIRVYEYQLLIKLFMKI